MKLYHLMLVVALVAASTTQSCLFDGERVRGTVTRTIVDGDVILEGTGTVTHPAPETGCSDLWGILGDDGEFYYLDGSGFPQGFYRDGLPVRFKGRLYRVFAKRCTSWLLKIIEIRGI